MPYPEKFEGFPFDREITREFFVKREHRNAIARRPSGNGLRANSSPQCTDVRNGIVEHSK
jgi:hypothetical protein